VHRPWTISKFHQWRKCGLQYALEHEPEKVLDRFPGWKLSRLPKREEGPALLRGTEIHEMLDVFLQTGIPPEEMHPQFPIFDRWGNEMFDLLESISGAKAGGSEVLWSFDDEWYAVEPGATVWHRQKLDAWHFDGETIDVIDYKSGRYYDTHPEAMEVYGLGAMAKFDAERAVTALWYVDQPKSKDNPLVKEFIREEDGPRLERRWSKRAEEFRQDTQYKAKPDRFNCRYCAFNAKKGGPCQKGV